MITLVIIGVVAALTVPTLITKYQKEQTVVRLKKAYSALAQTTQKAIADYGPMETWDITTSENADSAKKFLNQYVVPYLSVYKAPSASDEGLWNNIYYALDGGKRSYTGKFVRFYLNDGTSITATINAYNDYIKRMDLFVDINGDKKPNKLGRDIFVFIYELNGESSYCGQIQAQGIHQSRDNLLSDVSSNCNKNRGGERCAAVIIKDGWHIADDYPW